jgi:P-type Ca2+ transporter type 2C
MDKPDYRRLSLTQEPVDELIMKQKPRDPNENIFTRQLSTQIVVTGTILGAASIASQWWAIDEGYDLTVQYTMVFTVLALSQLGNALSIRSRKNLLMSGILNNKMMLWTIILSAGIQIGMLYVPFLQDAFRIAPLSWEQWQVVGLFTLGSLVLIELSKFIINRYVADKKQFTNTN